MKNELRHRRKALLASIMSGGYFLAACGGGSGAGSTEAAGTTAAAADGRESAQATTTTTWTKIANEGQTFTLATPRTVRFGTGSSWITKSVNGAGACTNAFFGKDPAYGKAKECDVAVTSAAPAPVDTSAVLGTASVQTQVDSNPAGQAEAFVYAAATSASVDTVKLFIDGGSTATRVTVGVYRDVNGSPGGLLSAATLTSPKAGAWNSLAIPKITLTGGTRYWIALLTPPGAGTLKFRDVASGGSSTVVSSQTNLSALPASWTTGARYANSPASVYLTTSAASTPAPSPAPAPAPTPSPSPSPSPSPAPSPSPSPSPAPAPAPSPAPAPAPAPAKLAWSASPDSSVTGYRVYYGTSPGTYLQARGAGLAAGNSTAYTVTNLGAGKLYYFVVTAIDGAGNESSYSNEVTKLIQ